MAYGCLVHEKAKEEILTIRVSSFFLLPRAVSKAGMGNRDFDTSLCIGFARHELRIGTLLSFGDILLRKRGL